jgi:hypothetical protein
VKDLLHVPEVRSEPFEAVEGKVTEHRILMIQGNQERMKESLDPWRLVSSRFLCIEAYLSFLVSSSFL